MDVFGIPGDGACLFTACDLALKARSVEFQQDKANLLNAQYVHFVSPEITLGAEHLSITRLSAAKKLWRRTLETRGAVESGGHAFVESRPTQSLFRNLIRDAEGVGLSQPHSVMMDIGSGTLGILLPQSYLHPEAVFIGVENAPAIFECGLSVYRQALADENYDGTVIVRGVTVDGDSDFSGVTNVDLFDGSPCLASGPDSNHAKLLGKLMGTQSIVEFCSVKCSSLATVTAYAEIDELFRLHLPQFKLLILKGCRQSKSCNFNTMMFVRLKHFRVERHVDPVPLGVRQSACVPSMIAAARELKAIERLPDVPRQLFHIMLTKAASTCYVSVKATDSTLIQRKILLGHVDLMCACTGLYMDFSRGIYHVPTGQRWSYVKIWYILSSGPEGPVRQYVFNPFSPFRPRSGYWGRVRQ